MVIENPMYKLAVAVSIVIFTVSLFISYLFFEKYLTEKEIVITVINKERFGSEVEKYLIFTPDEVFQNSNNMFHRKTNADFIYRKLERGVKYRVKVVGIYVPGIFKLRNITEIVGVELSKAN